MRRGRTPALPARSTAVLGHLLLGCVLLAHAGPALADWKRDYELGLRAVARGDWKEAEQRMRAALADDAEPSARKRFQGVKFDRYVPHWYAGLAAFQQGDCARAEGYWNDAASRGVVAGIDELAAEYRRLSAECARRHGTRAAAAAGADAKPVRADAGVDPAPVGSASTRPASTTSASTGSASTGSASTGSASTAAKPPPSAPTAAVAAPAAKQTPPPAVVAKAPAPAKPSSKAAVAPPALLRSTLEAWLAGRYELVAKVDAAALSDARARSQVLLLRAAARFVQAELAGTTGRELAAVREDIRAAGSGGAALDQSLYPPRFRALVAATR